VGEHDLVGRGIDAGGVRHPRDLIEQETDPQHRQRRRQITLAAGDHAVVVERRQREAARGARVVQQIEAAHGHRIDGRLFDDLRERDTDRTGRHQRRRCDRPVDADVGDEEAARGLERRGRRGRARQLHHPRRRDHLDGRTPPTPHDVGRRAARDQPIRRPADQSQAGRAEAVNGLEVDDRSIELISIARVACEVHDATGLAVLLQRGERLERGRQRVVCPVGDEHDGIGAVRGAAPLDLLEQRALGTTGGHDVEVRLLVAGAVVDPPAELVE
jgi:hypothetical protein